MTSGHVQMKFLLLDIVITSRAVFVNVPKSHEWEGGLDINVDGCAE